MPLFCNQITWISLNAILFFRILGRGEKEQGKLICHTYWLMFSFLTRGQSLCKPISVSLSLSPSLAFWFFSLPLPFNVSTLLSFTISNPAGHLHINKNRKSCLSLHLKNASRTAGLVEDSILNECTCNLWLLKFGNFFLFYTFHLQNVSNTFCNYIWKKTCHRKLFSEPECRFCLTFVYIKALWVLLTQKRKKKYDQSADTLS